MSRPPLNRSRVLPGLETLKAEFEALPETGIKQERVEAILRKVIDEYRAPENFPFYSMRQLAVAFDVSLRTLQVVFSRLEAEGMLISVRGAGTLMVGSQQQGKYPVAGVVGLPLWQVGVAQMGQYMVFALHLGDLLWKQAVGVDTILYWHTEDRKEAFVDRMLSHRMDFLVWFQPFRFNREVILRMRELGVRTLLISDRDLAPFPPDIELFWDDAYRALFRCWIEEHQINEILLIAAPPFTRAREGEFVDLAQKHGLRVQSLPATPRVVSEILNCDRAQSGIRRGVAILDEEIMISVVHNEPSAFIELVSTTRVFFGRGMVQVPYLVPPGLTLERSVAPAEIIALETVKILEMWRAGKAMAAPVAIQCTYIEKAPVGEKH